jgi:hypothetical protein
VDRWITYPGGYSVSSLQSSPVQSSPVQSPAIQSCCPSPTTRRCGWNFPFFGGGILKALPTPLWYFGGQRLTLNHNIIPTDIRINSALDCKIIDINLHPILVDNILPMNVILSLTNTELSKVKSQPVFEN